MLVKVKDGTNAGCKRERTVPTEDWTCRNGHVNRGYAKNCLGDGCREKRPS